MTIAFYFVGCAKVIAYIVHPDPARSAEQLHPSCSNYLDHNALHVDNVLLISAANHELLLGEEQLAAGKADKKRWLQPRLFPIDGGYNEHQV